jgi:hypothetical protein
MKKSYILFLILLSTCFFSSCTRKSDLDKSTIQSKDTTSKVNDPFVENLFSSITPVTADNSVLAPEEFRLRLNEMFMEYTHLKHALSENDSTQAIMQTNQMKKTVVNLKTGLLNDNLKKEWDKLSIKIDECCKGITTTENIEKQRKKFVEITGILTELVKNFGLKNKTVYTLNCPDKKAGNWLVDTKDISNPYLGKITNGEKPCVEIKDAVKFD